MGAFIAALQFLTRIRLKEETQWSAERFGKSVAFFPGVGLVLGMHLLLIHYILSAFLSIHLTALLLVIAGFVLTGALHCDGLMDTADGLLSGRSRERMLEIMKDSRVGASGVTVFVLLVLAKWALIEEISPAFLPAALITMPVISRVALSLSVTLYGYARPEGIGKLFAEYTGKREALQAFCLGALILIPLSVLEWRAALAAGISLVFSHLFCRYVEKKLGGLTGDTYGAVTELTELVALTAFLS
ncbi:MAG: adenosylcobinamide-GDP ribazoletransferase [Sporomusaceae bacterium]|nr:adenosylcobinamide-GDP ribazoletransferase [Sporomusaceae bacterium]